MRKLIFTMLLFFTVYSSQATIWYVDSTNTTGISGTSWSTAYPELSSVFRAFGPAKGDTIWVAKGTYYPYPGTGRTDEFEINGFHLYGGFDGTETMLSQRDVKANPTILSGDLNQNDNSNIDYTESTRSDNAYSVVSINTGSHPTTLDGFTMEGGNASGSTPGRQRYGGALYVLKNTGVTASGDVIVENCVFRKNTAVYTAGAYVYNISHNSTNSLKVIFNKCEFRNNQAIGTIIGQRASVSQTETYIFNSLITDNTTSSATLIGGSGQSGSASFYLGMMNSTIAGNHKVSTNQVKGMIRFYNEVNSSPTATIALNNNLILDDTVKNTIALSPGQVGALSNVYLGHNIYQDSLNDYSSSGGTVTDASGQHYVSAGADAKFKDAPNGDYSLTSCSDAVDAGISTTSHTQSFILQLFNTYQNYNSDDLANDTRVVGSAIDFGCYENQGYVFDLNFDGTNLTATSGLTNYSWKRNNTTITGANSATYTPTQNGNYEVTAEDANGCEHTASYNLNNLAVNDFATAKLKIYPNPVLDMLHIDGNVNEINIYDLSGKLLIKTSNKEINVASLAKGIYIIKATQDGQYYQSKFVKE